MTAVLAGSPLAAAALGHQTAALSWWQRRPVERHQPSVAMRAPEETDAASLFAFKALVVFTAVTIVAPQAFYPPLGRLRIPFLAAIAAIGAHMVSRFGQTHAGRPRPREVRLVLWLVAWAILTIPRSYWPGGSITVLTDMYLKSVAVFWLLGEVINTVPRLQTLAWTLSLVTVPVAISGLKAYAAGAFIQGAAGDRIGGYGGGLTANPNDVALLLNIILPLTASLAVCADRWTTRGLAITVAGLSMATVVVTFSRAGFLAMGMMGLLFMGRLAARQSWGAVIAIVIVGVLALGMVPGNYADRLRTITSVESDDTGSSQERWSDTVTAIQYIATHPLIGAGLGMDILALNEMRGEAWQHVHDVYLNYGVDLGLPGLCLFVAVLATSLGSAGFAQRCTGPGIPPELSVLASGVRISLFGFALSAFFYPVPYHFYFYYLSGLAVAVRAIASSFVPGGAAPRGAS